MKRSAAIIALALFGCKDPVQDAKTELDMLKQAHAKPRELCAAQKKLTQAYLEAHDNKNFQFQKLISDTECFSAELGGGLLPEEALPEETFSATGR